MGVVTASPYDSALPRARLPVVLVLSICPLDPSIPNPFLPRSQGADGFFAYWAPSLEGLGLIREGQQLGSSHCCRAEAAGRGDRPQDGRRSY